MKAASNYKTFDDAEKSALPKPAVSQSEQSSIWSLLTTVYLFVLWWVVSAAYNVHNKMAVNYTPAPLTIGAFQMGIGILWFVPLWIVGIRKAPTFHSAKIFMSTMGPQGFFHALCHLGGTAAMGAGKASFAQIVKAAEPVTTSFLTVLVFRHLYHWATYLTLVPIIGGVSFASHSDGSFTWYAVATAMMSNIGASARGVYAKKAMGNKDAIGTNLDAKNQYAVLVVLATIVCFLVAIPAEGLTIVTKFGFGKGATPITPAPSTWTVLWPIILSSVWYYAYNELAFLALARVNQLTHAVGNTVKRVVVIAAAVMFLHESWTWKTVTGSGIAILGTFLFSVCRMAFG